MPVYILTLNYLHCKIHAWYARVMHMHSSDELMLNIGRLVKEHLTKVLGNTTIQVIDSWLRQRGCRGIEDVCVDPERVKVYLELIFNDAALLLRSEMVRILEDELTSYIERYDDKDKERIKDVIDRLKSINK